MVSLGQKLKMPKRYKKPFYNNIRVYSRKETTLKIGFIAKAITHGKALLFANWSVWVKI